MKEQAMVIRPKQMQAFSDAAVAHFEDEMLNHLKGFAPKHCEIMGDDGVRQLIRLGMERARGHNLTNRGPVRLYLELMFLFGSDFDTDPQLRWVAEILGQPGEEMTRADLLHQKLKDYLDKVAGPENKFAKDALQRASKQRFEDLPVSGGDATREILRRLQGNYPEKYQYVGEEALRPLIPLGIELARRNSVSTNAGVVLLVGLAFTLGHGFATDIQFPWVASTLRNEAIGDPNKRVERLYSKAMTYLGRVLAYHER
jgi:hypothetical protein